MLYQRIIFGSLIAAGIIAVMLTDGALAARHPSPWLVAGADLEPWLLDGAVCTALVLLFALGVARELTRFAHVAGYRPLRVETYVFAAGLVVGPYVAFHLHSVVGRQDESWAIAWLALALGVTFVSQAVRRGTEKTMANLATTLFIIFYAGGLAGFMVRLRMEVGGQAGMALLLFSVFVVKINDAGAFFVGRRFGRRKLIEWLSPNKTWEGLVGGLVVSVIGALTVGTYLHRSGIAALPDGWLAYPWGLMIFGLLMGLLSVTGDLAASLLKRDAAVKDSACVIPGLGGALDVFDSPLLAAPAAWFFWTRLVPLASDVAAP